MNELNKNVNGMSNQTVLTLNPNELSAKIMRKAINKTVCFNWNVSRYCFIYLFKRAYSLFAFSVRLYTIFFLITVVVFIFHTVNKL